MCDSQATAGLSTECNFNFIGILEQPLIHQCALALICSEIINLLAKVYTLPNSLRIRAIVYELYGA